MDKTALIRDFIKKNFFVSGDLRENDSLLDRGIIDSTGVLEVVSFLETEFGIVVLDQEMLPENLDSIVRIAAYVDRKRAASAKPAA
ncbi:MAG TPA: acyl carrier protein [Anaeromyxobacteraceae bacterium]|nr:acyl carrier protein [Anaeromyxobacteraceae bacterium]